MAELSYEILELEEHKLLEQLAAVRLMKGFYKPVGTVTTVETVSKSSDAVAAIGNIPYYPKDKELKYKIKYAIDGISGDGRMTAKEITTYIHKFEPELDIKRLSKLVTQYTSAMVTDDKWGIKAEMDKNRNYYSRK